MRLLALITCMALSFAANADTIQLREDAPDRHEVVKGDTLWDISAKFLKSPWKWPEVWQANKDRIRNPHLIYPGDIVLLTRTPGGPQLSTLATVRLTPGVTAEPIPAESAIPTIPYTLVSAFLQRPLVADAATLADAPRIIGSEDNRVMLSIGDRIYARGGDQDRRFWHIVRLGKVLKDPATDQELSHEVDYIGDARTVVWDRPSTLQITRTDKEVAVDDRLIAEADVLALDFMPHAPAQPVDGQIIAAYGAGQTAGKYSTLIINKGRQDGLEVGHVLAVYRVGKTLGKDRSTPKEFKDTGKEISSFNPRSGYLDAALERERHMEYKDFGDEFADFIDPFDFFFKPFPDGRRGWRYLDRKCLKQDARVSSDTVYDPSQVMEECGDAPEAAARKWAYMDIGCLKPGKQIAYNEPFDPREVYQPHCRPIPPVKLPDVRNGLVMVYRVFDKVAYALVMDSPNPLYLLDHVRNP